MLEIIAASTFAVAIAVVVKSHKSGASKLTESRASMQTIGVQIICGDCSGNDYSPVKTPLSQNGLCGQCGGRSYILASARISPAQQAMIARLSRRSSFTDDCAIAPPEPVLRPRTNQRHSIPLDKWHLVT
jgi:hypothetical protein